MPLLKSLESRHIAVAGINHKETGRGVFACVRIGIRDNSTDRSTG
jgi:hypothetical protein